MLPHLIFTKMAATVSGFHAVACLLVLYKLLTLEILGNNP